MQRLLLTLYFLLFLAFQSLAQVPLGSWREHLPYLHGTLAVPATNRVFCAGNESLFALRTDDNSVERFSKLNGLNDFGVSAMAYSSSYHFLIVAYSNSNIDLISDDNTITNLSDVKRKNIPGDKSIYAITLSGKNAYLACGFGIVVFDLQKKEIKDTYYIGTAGASVVVHEVSEDDTYLYAATDDAIYRADKSAVNLADFNNWSVIYSDNGDANKSFTQMVRFGQQQIVCQKRSSGGDSLLVYDGVWGVANPLMNYYSGGYINALHCVDDKIVVVNDFSVSCFDASFQRTLYLDGTIFGQSWLKDARPDANGIVWAADGWKGLVRATSAGAEANIPEGPGNAQSSQLLVQNGVLHVVHGINNRSWGNQYHFNGFSSYKNGSWQTVDGYSSGYTYIRTYNFFDAATIAVDPANDEHYFVGSSGSGLLEMNGDQVGKFYRDTNSLLQQMVGNPGQVIIHGMAFDQNRNLWIANSGTAAVLKVLKPDGSWLSFGLSGKVNSSSKAGDLIIDDYGYVWTTLFENIGGKDGVLMYDTHGTLEDMSDDTYDIADFASIRVRTLAKDKEGLIWAGTEKGIYVFYPPSLTPQKILIRQDNTYQYLLETDVVTAIAVDAANRKWIGTEAGGLYLFSADGLTQIAHYTSDNSPLFSNNISTLAIDGASGELYVGTEKGLLSFRSDAVEGETGCSGITIYPSPVSHAYDGPIAIKGLVSNGIIKITDISGKIVFETRSLGSQAIWDGRNFEGERVATGVYLVLASDKTGDNTCVTKLMVSH